MTTIGVQQATMLADLMKRTRAHAATTEEIVIHGVKATVIILDHEDQREGSWKTVHVIGQFPSGIASLGTMPKGTR